MTSQSSEKQNILYFQPDRFTGMYKKASQKQATSQINQTSSYNHCQQLMLLATLCGIIKERVQIETISHLLGVLNHTDSIKSYSGERSGHAGTYKLKSQLHQFITKRHMSYFRVGTYNMLFLFIGIQYLQKMYQLICSISRKNSKHRRINLCIEVKDNSPMFMKINSLLSIMICNLTFTFKAYSSPLHL